MKKIFILFLLLFVSISAAEDSFSIDDLRIDRRESQFRSESSYLLFPLYYSKPGMGSGFVFTALAGNMGDTYADGYLLGVTGDAEGVVASLEDIHILPKLLILGLQRYQISKAVVNYYEKRGMDSKKNDFNLMEADKYINNHAELKLTLYDRMLDIYASIDDEYARVVSIKDSEGNMISDLTDPFIHKVQSRRFGILLDYTDDREDPKKGVRFRTEYKSSPAQSKVDPEFYTIDKSLSFYLPLTPKMTWAFNFFLSDAHVTQKGEVNPDAIREELGFGCSPLDYECLKAEQDQVDITIAARTNGTSASLGGDNRLRSYPDGRYSGAHTSFYSTELRWNLSNKVRPFNFGIWKDVATGLQLALFYETGSVAESRSELGDKMRSSYGAGIRMVSASGYVYRADFSTGDEGEGMVVIFSYPW